MSPTSEAFLKDHRNADGTINWPPEENARIQLAQTLLGIHWIQSCDALYEAAIDVLSNPSPPKPYVRPESEIARKDADFRRIFSTLNSEQRRAVLKLIHGQTYGMLCALLFDLDQFPYSQVTVTLSNMGDEPSFHVQAIPGANGIGIGESCAWWVRDLASFPLPDGGSATAE